MASAHLIESLHFVKGLNAVADAFTATATSDVVNMQAYGEVAFLIHKAAGATGTSTITVEACDDVVPTNTTAIPFHYRAVITGDTEGVVTAAAATGFATTAGAAQFYVVEVDDSTLAASGYSYVRLKAVEVADDPVLGGIIIIQACPRYVSTVKGSTII